MTGTDAPKFWAKPTRPPRAATPGFKLRQAARSIRRWSPPRAQEPAHGLMLRLAGKHWSASAVDFAEGVGVDRITDAQACLDALAASPLADPPDIEALRLWTPRLHGADTRRNKRMWAETNYAFASFGGETVRRRDWSAAKRRCCPGCLAESDHHRAWFDLTFVRACPIHGLALTDEAADGSRATWLDTQVGRTREGAGLGIATPRLDAIPETVEAYALGRMGVLARRPNPLLDPHPLHEVLEAAEMMGRLALGGRCDDMPLVGRCGLPAADLQAVGYAMLKDGETGARALFADVAARAPETAFGARELFGWAYTGFSFKEALSIELRRLMVEVAAGLGRNGRRYAGQAASPVGERLTLREVANVLGCSEDTARHLAETTGMLLPHVGSKGTPHLVGIEGLPVIAALFAGSITRTEAAARLGVTAATFAEIVLAGHIPKVGTRWGDDGLEDRFATAELDRFLGRIPCAHDHGLRPGARVVLAPHLLTVPDALAASRYDAGVFFADVFAGALRIHSRTALEGGLAAFLIAPDGQPQGSPFVKRCRSTVMTRSSAKVSGMTQREACALLDVSPPTAKALTDLGYLRIEDGRVAANRQKLDRASVEAFAARYAAGKLYAGALGCQNSKVSLRLAGIGIADLVRRDHPDASFGAKLSPLYDRAELRHALGLARDPDEDDAHRAFWKKVATSLGRNMSNFMLWHAGSDGVAMFSTSERAWPIEVSLTFEGPTDTLEGYPDAYKYILTTELTLVGVEAAARGPRLLEIARTRPLPAPIAVAADEMHGTLSARLDLPIFIPTGFGRNTPEFVLTMGEAHAGLIQRMLETIKGSLEDGERPFERRGFGLWPTRVRWW